MNVPLESKYWCLENNLSQEEGFTGHQLSQAALRDFLYLTESRQARLSLGAGWPSVAARTPLPHHPGPRQEPLSTGGQDDQNRRCIRGELRVPCLMRPS